jgi:hypothetical protein
MRDRCSNPNSISYSNYGGRGIRVCARWESFPDFLADMGLKPTPKHTIDRIDVNGHYEPGNCRWASRHEQAGNRRTSHLLEIEGVRSCLTEWSVVANAPPSRIQGRLIKGWSPTEAVFTPKGGRFRADAIQIAREWALRRRLERIDREDAQAEAAELVAPEVPS